MTSTIEPGSREDYLRLLDEGVILTHSREWYEADGPVEMGPSDRVRADVREFQLTAAPMTVPALGYMLDYSGARPDLNVAKRTGAKIISRYISPPIASTAWKRIGTSERDNILKIIGDLWLNWEWYAGRMLEGSKAGAEDGKWALAAVEGLSYPRGRIIPASHDTGTINDSATLAYCAAFNKALGGAYKMTVYGSYHTVTSHANKSGVQPVPWQTAAWSNRQKAAIAAVYQNTNQWFNHTVDENEIWKMPFGTWNHPYPAVTPTPPPGGTFDFTKVVALYKNQAEFESAVETQVLNVLSSALWGDPRGLTPAQMTLLTHNRPSLGIYDGMVTQTRGRFVRFSKDPVSPSAIYEKVGDRLLWLTGSDWKELNTPFALLPVVDHSITGNVYKLAVADGTTDPRKAPVAAEHLNYNESSEEE